MSSWSDRWRQMSGQTRFIVSRIFIHLAGKEVAPLLGVLNQAARKAVESEGDLSILGEGLVEICQGLLQWETYWQAAANEGEVFWEEEAAGDYVEELFTDSAQRYLSQPNLYLEESTSPEFLTLPVTQNLVVMLTVALEGEVPALETELANFAALKAGLQALINLHYQDKLRAIQVHFSPAQLGDQLTSDQLIQNFPELVPL